MLEQRCINNVAMSSQATHLHFSSFQWDTRDLKAHCSIKFEIFYHEVSHYPLLITVLS